MKNAGKPFLIHRSKWFEIRNSRFPYNPAMSEVPPEDAQPRRRVRLLWTLLGAMILVGLVPLVVSHYFLIGINRESLQTLEQKYDPLGGHHRRRRPEPPGQ